MYVCRHLYLSTGGFEQRFTACLPLLMTSSSDVRILKFSVRIDVV